MTGLIPFFLTWGIFLALSGLLARALAVVSGFYKDPLLGHFRRYGDEYHHSPLAALLTLNGIWSIWMTVVLHRMGWLARWMSPQNPSLIFIALAVMSFGAALLVYRQPALSDVLPTWYYTLLRTATREERRFIAFHWLRLPRRLRWRLNSDQRAFQVWADMVRIAYIYGAYDPDSIWDRWQ